MMQNNRGKVEKGTFVHWVDLALHRVVSNFNILTGFRATQIWPLNLERMQGKIGSSRPFYSTPSCKVIVEEIIEKDLQKEEDDVLYYYIEDEGVKDNDKHDGSKIVAEISHFLKLLQKPL